MKKLIFPFLLNLMFGTMLFAENTDNSIVNQLRAEQIFEFKDNLDAINSKIESYVIASGDITPTKQEISIFYSLPSNYFNNFDGNSLNINLNTTTNKILISNTLGTTTNQSVIEAYLSNYSNDKVFSSNNNYDVTYLIEPKTSNFIDLISTLQTNTNIVISNTQPSDTTKTWYEPIGNGSFKIYSYNASNWNYVGTSDYSNNANIQTSTLTELNAISCILNDKGFVVATTADSYVCTSNNKWVKINTGDGSSMYNGDATILEMLTSLKDYKSTSVVTASDPYTTGFKHIYNGVKNYTKRDSTNGLSYWIDDLNNIIVGETINHINSRNMPNNSYGYIVSTDKTKVYPLQKINNNWMIIVDGYNDVVTLDITTQIVYDKKNNKYFKYSSNYWYEINVGGTNLNTMYLTSHSNGRSIFPAPSSSTVKYLTLNNDCLTTTCYGPVGTNYFGGEKLDSMYVYYYSTAGKRENNLIDAVPAISIGDIYSRNLYAGLYNNVVYIKDLDTLGRTCYQNVVNSAYYTSGGVSIPTGNNLPSSVNCSTATYTSGTYLNLTNRTDATNWTTAPDGALVYLTSISTNYAHILNGSLDFWTNNATGDGQASATEIFTRGSRTSFPNVTHNINALTKLVDTPNYVGGVTSTIDNSFKQWYYVSGYGIKNLVDVPIVTSYIDMYNNNSNYIMYNGIIYQKGTDSLSRTCYQNLSTGKYWTKTGYQIPTANDLPSSVNCSTATYSGGYLILSNRTAATDWTTAPNLAGVQIAGNNYGHILNGSLDFWTNNGSGDGQQSATEIFTKGSRTSLPTITHSLNVLTKLVDTPNYTSVGLTSTIDNSFKQWYYANGMSIKNLIDVLPVTSYIDMYNTNYSKAMYNGVIYNKSIDTLSRTCYQNSSTGKYWTKTGYLIQTGNDLPSSVNCSTATYTNTVYLNLGTRTDATNWTTAPHGAGIYLTSVGSYYMKVKSGTMDFYTNNGGGDYQSGATEIFTNGTRANFPIVTHTLLALTKQVDTPNNTGVGLTSNEDNSFKEWYYANGVGVKNLIDSIITTNAYIDTNAINFGIATQSGKTLQKCGNYWCLIGTSQVVDSNLVNSISSTVVPINGTNITTNCTNSSFSQVVQQPGTIINDGNCQQALNGKWYTQCYPIMTNIASRTFCKNGMSLPKHTETSTSYGSITNGVPSCSGYTWTWYIGDCSSCFAWFNTTAQWFARTQTGYVRCVK